ncbi:hypothetical protein [Streptomyces sp. NPDC057426]|uniref:hypothetical protein n=1 Tax=Streptomyces sp. NPDC057426 TaxID=3346128 RepID=UPI0036B966A2
MTAVQSDRAKAGRVLEAIPTGAPWLTWLSRGAPLRRVPVPVSHGAEDALEALRRDVVDFTEPGLADAHQGFVEALDHLVDHLGGMFAPDTDGPVTYTEVPPEWERTDRERYYQTLRDLSQARDTFLDSYKELMNAMSQEGHLPAPQDPPPGPSLNITTGDNSPVNASMPYAHASHGATAVAGAAQPPEPTTRTPWYRSVVLWTAVAAVAGVGAAIGAFVK